MNELTKVPQYRRTARFENKVGFKNVVAGESILFYLWVSALTQAIALFALMMDGILDSIRVLI
jgi:hypothetical protein